MNVVPVNLSNTRIEFYDFHVYTIYKKRLAFRQALQKPGENGLRHVLHEEKWIQTHIAKNVKPCHVKFAQTVCELHKNMYATNGVKTADPESGKSRMSYFTSSILNLTRPYTPYYRMLEKSKPFFKITSIIARS